MLLFWICPSFTIPQVLFWLLDVGITMHVVRDLDNLLLLPEFRNLDSPLTEIRDLDSLLTEIRYWIVYWLRLRTWIVYWLRLDFFNGKPNFVEQSTFYCRHMNTELLRLFSIHKVMQCAVNNALVSISFLSRPPTDRSDIWKTYYCVTNTNVINYTWCLVSLPCYSVCRD
jgi:hypothetical protein